MDPRRRNELRSIALHAAVVELLRADPTRLADVSARLTKWLADGRIHAHYARAWKEAIEGPFDALAALLVADTDAARALRQTSPFAGVLDPRTRWRILREASAP